MKRFVRIFLVFLLTGLFSNISSSARPTMWPPISLFSKSTNTVKPSISQNIITGLATFYSSKFEGNQTATGEIFHHTDLTAASNLFALNTWVKVTNILTGKSIIVRINDRMHPSMSKKGRVLDLTLTGAKELKIVDRGVAKVKIEPISGDVAASNN